jgi:glycosyltransferase involved in cell wall biosynthesis
VRIAVCRPQEPFKHGGAEIFADTLVAELRTRATSANVAGRLASSTGLSADVLPHPPQELDYRCDAYEPFVLSVGRLDSWKRVDLLLEAASLVPGLDVVVAGSGPEREPLEQLAAGRARFVGRVSPGELAGLYATCRAVYYGPFDEDFGMVPLEAFRAAKPVITTADAGGPLDFVIAGETGWVAEPTPEGVAIALREALGDERLARRYGETGKPRADAITWDAALGRLLGQ